LQQLFGNLGAGLPGAGGSDKGVRVGG